MENLVLVGAGGCMRELLWQITEYNKKKQTWRIIGYIDQAEDLNLETIGHCPYLGDDDYLISRKEEVNVAICIADPQKRAHLVEMYSKNPKIKFPNIVLGDTCIAKDVNLGQGIIISRGCTVSTNVHIGDFTFLNMGSMICHDGMIGSFTTFGPRATVAGNVKIGDGCYIGISSTVIQGIEIGDGVTVGGGAMVVNDIPEKITVVGVPAKPMKK
ncbi:MAG: acetyltransferase [Lachnospiraceae bacterium]|nr:acetyltransferase [Lachnospiraceae bacterium]